MRTPTCAVLLLLTACGALSPPRADAGGEADAGAGGGLGGGTGGGGGGGLDSGVPTGTIFVEPLYEARSRLGARSTRGFRPWRGGLAVVGTWLYWVESGTAPGLYRAPLTGCDGGTCVEKLATFTRPSVFAATADAVVTADVTLLRRYPLVGAMQAVATASDELVNLTADATAAYWTTESSPIGKTPYGGSTSTLINSNGTPVAIGLAGDRVHWAGVDISGQLGALQSIRTDGSNPREDSRFSAGFHTLRGDGTYLYYARDTPAQIFRLTLSNQFLETAATNAQGVADFALDATHAYWVEPGSSSLANGRVRRVAHESTTPETLATAVPFPLAIAVKDGVIYVAAAGTQAAGFADGKLLRISIR